MALIKCRECSGPVSSEAAACPKCGAKPRAPMPAQAKRPERGPLIAIAILIVTVGFVGTVGSLMGPTDGERAVNEASKAAACKADLQCWAAKSEFDAAARCARQIELLALHSVRWIEGDKFTHLRWADKTAGAVTYIGDRVEFQNGFGAYTPMTYECDFDQANKAVLDVRIAEGRHQ